MKQNKPVIIGLSGSSGSGKSTVGEILADLGCLVIDCDKTAHENMEKGGLAYDDIVKAFGSEILDENGEIDRRILGPIVFADKEKLKMLNSISHAYIKQRIKEIIGTAFHYKYVVIDAALLYESGLMEDCDICWLVTADEKTRLKRVMLRDGIDENKAYERFRNQRDDSEIKHLFQIVTENEFSTREELEKDVKEKFYSITDILKYPN